MTKRQPKGTPVGGQFAPDRKPGGGDLTVDTCSKCGGEIRALPLYDPTNRANPFPPGVVRVCTNCGDRPTVNNLEDVAAAAAALDRPENEIGSTKTSTHDVARSTSSIQGNLNQIANLEGDIASLYEDAASLDREPDWQPLLALKNDLIHQHREVIRKQADEIEALKAASANKEHP